MDGLYSLLLVIEILTLGIAIWQVRLLWLTWKKINSNVSVTDNEKYFELKYHLQYITTIFPIALAILGIFGYNKIEDLPTKIKADITTKIQPTLDSLKKSRDSLEFQYNQLSPYVKQLQDLALNTDTTLTKTSKGAKDLSIQVALLQLQINSINSKDIIKQPIYIVRDLIYRTGNFELTWATYYYKNMKTISGESLPSFTKPPLIYTYSDRGIQMEVCNVTTESFKVSMSPMTTDTSGQPAQCGIYENMNLNFSIMVIR